MISPERFLVESLYEEEWLAARRKGVSATQVATAATPSGFAEVVEDRRNPKVVEPNAYMIFGSESENEIMRFAHREFGVLQNRWLLAAAENPLHIATPDGLSLDHRTIAEVKTTGTDWGDKIPIKYRRQVQWQLHVSDAERCLFLWQLRVPDDGAWFYMPWLEPKHTWFVRDEKMIAELVGVADRLLCLED